MDIDARIENCEFKSEEVKSAKPCNPVSAVERSVSKVSSSSWSRSRRGAGDGAGAGEGGWVPTNPRRDLRRHI